MRHKDGGEGALGRAIRVVRTQRGLNRKELAERSGLSYPYLSEIEAGRKTPSARALGEIAEALEVAPHELMQAGEAMSQPGDASWFSPRHAFFPKRADSIPLTDSLRATQRSEAEGPDEALIATLAATARELCTEDVRRLIDLALRLRR